MLIRKIKFVS